MKEVTEKVYSFKTKHKHGFTNNELDILLKDFPNISMEKFENALMGNTCILIGGDVVKYHSDIEKALICGLQNRDLNVYEWD